MGSLIVAILVIIVVVSLFYGNNNNYNKVENEKEVIAKLRARYQEALKAGNKEKAWKYGRDYYAYLRNNRQLSKFDEQAIANDISTIM
jgi:hypothetical protein